jgi:hypothetical protein
MPIAINGSGTITGLSAGGLPANSITSASIADNAITSGKLATGVGGKILQVVEATHSTEVSSTSKTMADTGLTASITPASGSKVLIYVSQSFRQYRDRGSTNNMGFGMNLLRGSTIIMASKRNDNNEFNDHYLSNTSVNNVVLRHSMNFLDDSPGGNGSTAITYKTQFACTTTDDSGQVWAQPSWESQNQQPTSSMILMEVAA